jgi:hypothetical protein
MKTTRSWFAGAVAMLAVIGLAASCAPPAPGGGPATTNWAFKGTSVKVNSSQDAVYDPIFGAALDSVIGSTPFPTISIPVLPDITGGGFYTLTGTKNFSQTFTGGGGQHTWTMQSGMA